MPMMSQTSPTSPIQETSTPTEGRAESVLAKDKARYCPRPARPPRPAAGGAAGGAMPLARKYTTVMP